MIPFVGFGHRTDVWRGNVIESRLPESLRME